MIPPQLAAAIMASQGATPPTAMPGGPGAGGTPGSMAPIATSILPQPRNTTMGAPAPRPRPQVPASMGAANAAANPAEAAVQNANPNASFQKALAAIDPTAASANPPAVAPAIAPQTGRGINPDILQMIMAMIQPQAAARIPQMLPGIK